MAYLTVINKCRGLTAQDKTQLIAEFDLLRTELNEIRAAFMKVRSLLVGGTAVGAGYNVAGTSLGTAVATADVTSNRFVRT